MTDPAPSTCPGCQSREMKIFHEVDSVPGNSCILLASEEEALAYPQGTIQLGFCPGCGFISNVAFEPRLTEYSGRYEETQGYSPTFNAFHQGLAERLIERYGLHGKDIIEIGCGKGEFLQLLCELGDNRGIGFDPGVHVDRIQGPAAARMRFIADFYSEKYADHQADFLVCKMTLEHIHNTGEFIAALRRAIGERVGTPVFFQVPEATRILRDCAFEDIYYEHCSYFSPGSLARLFRANGFEVLNLSTEYEGQYLTLEARATSASANQLPLPQEADIELLAGLVRSFPPRLAVKRREWAARLQDIAGKDSKAVIWGAASKAVALLATLPEAQFLRYGVDINPHKQGHFLPGTGLPVVGPGFLVEYRPDLVVIMNPIYREEIQRDLGRLGLTPEIVTL